MDLFLESQVRDLVATAKQQLASQGHGAALVTYRTALDAVDNALALDPANQSATLLRQQLIETIRQVTPASYVGQAPAGNEPFSRSVNPPSFQLLKEGDAPVFEKGEDLFGSERGSYLPAPELLSILDETARPEKPDYLRVVAAVVIAVLLAVAIRVTLYYSTRQVRVDATPLEQRAKYAPLPAAAAAQSNPEPVDDTIYWAESGITLPLLRFKSEPLQANSAGTVVLIAVIDSSGKPVNMQVRQGLNPDLNVLAMQAASRWRFRPGTKDGKPVPVAAQLEVNFRGP